MRKIYVIGIGAGGVDQLTVQAVRALNAVDVFFVLDKGAETSDLLRFREEVLRRHIDSQAYRLVRAPDPGRDRSAGGVPYRRSVSDWRSRRAGLYERMIAEELGEEETGGFLVWGDPALYDPTLGILDDILKSGRVRFHHEVIPGISSVAALSARHRISLSRVAGAVLITTGRRLAEGWPEGIDDVVVMLDAHQSFLHHLAADPLIYWGAYLGTPDEILVAGRLSEVAGRIQEARSAARARKGWIMDSYLLRRRS